MIPLKVQAGSIFFSFFMGFLSFLIYDFFNRIFYKKQGKFIRLIFEISLFSSLALIYYYILCSICSGKYNIFYFAFFGIGLVVYYTFYRIHFLRKIEQLTFYLKKYIYIPLLKRKRSFILRLKKIFKIKKKERKKKSKRSKKLKKI